MLIPEEILKTLLCSECECYLNVPPVKVYPNRHKKCGRCAEEHDNGVISSCYLAVIRGFEFPCVNRYEGCTEILKYDEVEQHEKSCPEGEHECPLCDKFEGDNKTSAYKLVLHLISKHEARRLPNMEIFIELDQGNRQQIAWFLNDQFLLIIYYIYDDFDNVLSLEIYLVGHQDREFATQSVTLTTINNEVRYSTKSLPCSLWGDEDSIHTRIAIKICPEQYPRNLAVCRFKFSDLVQILPVVNDLQVISRSASHVKVNCLFENVSRIVDDKRIYFASVIYINNTKWKSFIARKNVKGVWHLSCYLECMEADLRTNNYFCYLTLICKNNIKYPIKWFNKKHYIWKEGMGTGLPLLSCDTLFDEKNGYIQNDSIQIDIEVKYDSPHQKQVGKSEISVCKNCYIKPCKECSNSGFKEESENE